MMNEQERVELEAENDGFRNDYQRAFAASCTRREPGQKSQADALVHAGRFVVVEHRMEYCGITGGVMGSRILVDAHFHTRLEARMHVAKKTASDWDESQFEIWPLLLPRKAAPQPATNEECPF